MVICLLCHLVSEQEGLVSETKTMLLLWTLTNSHETLFCPSVAPLGEEMVSETRFELVNLYCRICSQ